MRHGRTDNPHLKRVVLRTFVLLVAIALSGCAKPPEPPAGVRQEEPVAQPPPPVAAATPEAQPPPPVLPPPSAEEVSDALLRVFQYAAVADTNRSAYYFVGDFNGDSSQDIAVVVRPAMGRLTEMNAEYPAWMLRDPLRPNLPPQLRKTPLRVETTDVLMAVIHGYGPRGWRSPEATQTYLLKGGAGAGIRTQPASETRAVDKSGKVPKLYGDTIAQVLEGASGFLYYTGAGYGWYDPKTFEPEAQQRMAHPGVAARK